MTLHSAAVRRRRAVAAAGAVSAGLLVLSACDKPTPMATITVGSSSVSDEAQCGGEDKVLEPTEVAKCIEEAKTGKGLESITVDADETVRFGVDPDMADKRWTILMNGTQLTDEYTKTYRSIPGSVFFNVQYGAQGDETIVSIRTGDGKENSESATGLWSFKLKKAD